MARLTHSNAGLALQICESVTLLHQLGSCTDEMRQQFLDWHQDYFARALAPFQVGESSANCCTSPLDGSIQF